jgi:large subunit ribosomal protein L30
MSVEDRKRLAVIRMRGRVNARKTTEDTLQMLNLFRRFNCVIIDDRPSYRGMLQKIKDWATWGEIDSDTIELLLKKRGEISETRKKITDDLVKRKTSYSSVSEFAQSVYDFKAEFSDLPSLKKVFRLHPPRKGLKDIKASFTEGGDLGYRGSEIIGLIQKMI